MAKAKKDLEKDPKAEMASAPETPDKAPEETIAKDGTVGALSSPPKKETKGNWIKVTLEQVKSLQAEGKLVGYRPSTGEALRKE